MNLVFTNTVLLPLALLVLVPLILHLFARAKPPIYPFSSVEFLRRIIRQSIRLKKPQALLVLLLRTLLIAAIIGLFLRPVLFGHRPLPGAGTRRNVVLVIDGTASMAAVEGSQTRFSLACAKASDLLAQLSTSDLADIVWLGTPNHAEFPQLSPNREYLKKALRTASIGYEAADIPGGLAMAADLLQGREGARELYLLSDFQAATWQGIHPTLPPDLKLVALKIGEKELPNLALTSIYAEPSSPLVGQEAKIFCDIQNYSSEHALNTLYLRTGETQESREIRLSPRQKTTAIFQVKYLAPGEHPISISLNEDAFPYDNQRWTVINVLDHLKAGIFNAEKETAEFWRRAIDSFGWAKTETINETRLLQPITSDLLLLSGWNPSPDTTRQIQDYLNRGGLVVWSPPAQCAWTNFAWLPLTPSPGNAPTVVWEKAAQPWRLRINDPEFPALKIFEGGLYGDPVRGQFLGRLKFSESSLNPGKIILAYNDRVPALVHYKNNGNLFLWNLPLQREFSDYAAQMEFLPFFGELILQHRHAPANATLSDLPPGMPLSREFEAQILDTDVRLQTGNNTLPLKRETTRTGVAFTSENMRQPGIYEWTCRGQSVGHQTVNFPTVESDLLALPCLNTASGNVINLAPRESVKQLREGTPLWPLLLALALTAALLEGLVLWRIDKL
jgi:hypothetical protein